MAAAFPITVTDDARSRLRELTAQKAGAKGVLLRIAKGKGCGGNEYRMEHVLEDKPGLDRVDLGDGAALYIPMEDSFYLFGMVIDFKSDELSNSKFTFVNPNVAGVCGCGESFSLDRDVNDPNWDPASLSCSR